jgi:hypothetical protein
MLLPARLLRFLNIHKQAKQKIMKNDELWGGVGGGRERFIDSLKLFFLPRSLGRNIYIFNVQIPYFAVQPIRIPYMAVQPLLISYLAVQPLHNSYFRFPNTGS